MSSINLAREIPATPQRPSEIPTYLPSFLAETPLADLAAEFAKMSDLHARAAAEHRAIATPAALEKAHADDRAAHGQALRAGKPDPGPVHVQAWVKREQEARRTVEGAGEALLSVWRDLVTAVADDNIGGAVERAVRERAEALRAELGELVGKLRSLMNDLDSAAFRVEWMTRARRYAIEKKTGKQFGGMPARWPHGGTGSAMHLRVNGGVTTVEEVLNSIERYRADQ